MNTATAHPFERACWVAAGSLAFALLLSIYREPLGTLPVALITGLVVLSAVAPWPALLSLAAAGPLASGLLRLTGPSYEVRFEEIAVLAFIAGAAAHHGVRPGRGPLPAVFRWSSGLLLLTTLASAVVVLAGMAAANPGLSALRFTWRVAFLDYLSGASPLASGMLFLEGPVLALLCAELCARGPRARARTLVGAMVASAAAVGVLTIVRLVSVAWAREDFWAAIVTLVAQFRVSVVHPDLNAAGSYFAMMLCAAFVFARHARAMAAALPLIGLGLWTSGSRAAVFALALLVAVAAVHRSSPRLTRPIVALGTALLVLLLAAVSLYPAARNENARAALMYRMQLTKAAAYAFTEAPLFGIGPGRFHDESMRYVAASRHADTPLHVGGRENAHNNFAQIGAELGALGLGLFLMLIAAALRQPTPPATMALWPVAAGVATYLLTCIVGHPLLVASAAYPFWLLMGVAANGGAATTVPLSRFRWAAAAIGILVVVGLPFRVIHSARSADLEHAGVGVSMWQRDEAHIRFRWAGGRSSLYAPAGATAIRIPLRHGGLEPRVIEVRIFIQGREADRVRVESGSGWHVARLLMPRNITSRFAVVDLLATVPGSGEIVAIEPTNEAGALMVGRIDPEGVR